MKKSVVFIDKKTFIFGLISFYISLRSRNLVGKRGHLMPSPGSSTAISHSLSAILSICRGVMHISVMALLSAHKPHKLISPRPGTKPAFLLCAQRSLPLAAHGRMKMVQLWPVRKGGKNVKVLIGSLKKNGCYNWSSSSVYMYHHQFKVKGKANEELRFNRKCTSTLT